MKKILLEPATITNMKKIIYIIILVLSIVPNAANAMLTSPTAGDLLELCEGQEAVRKIACGGFVNGFLQGAAMSEIYFGYINEGFFCLDKNVTIEQIAKMFVKMASENPERHHFAAGTELGVMLNEAFPCGKESIQP